MSVRNGTKRRDVPVGPGPWRTCIGCRAVRRPDDPEAGLVRFIRVEAAAGTVEYELSRNGPGRGAWLCSSTSSDVAGSGVAGLQGPLFQGAGSLRIVVVNPKCLASATKRQAFAKALRVSK